MAPDKADCLTATAYFFEHAYSYILPIYNIGDMARMLTKVHTWQIKKISSNDMQEGDLILVKAKNLKRLVHHIGWYYKRSVWHLSEEGLQKQSIDEFFQVYEQTLKKKIVKYIDRRNWISRSIHKGHLLR